MPEAKKLQHRITSGYIQVVTDGGQAIPAFWAHPQHGRRFPGLILLHDDRGLSAHTRALVHRFAEVGYYVIAPDLFEGQHPTTLDEAAKAEKHFFPKAPAKVQAALSALESHHKSNNKMAVVGWDFGGTLAYELVSTSTDIMAAVSFYGNPEPYFDKITKNTCPVLAIFGQHDEIVRQHESKLREVFIRSGKPHEVIVYPDALHNFYNDFLPTYNKIAAEDAWIQTIAFLETHQGKPPAPESAKSQKFSGGKIY